MKTFMQVITVSLCLAAAITVSAENLLKDTNFSKENGWNFWVEKIAEKAGASVTMQDGKVTAKSPALDKQVHANIQLIKAFEVSADKTYKAKFKANADKAGNIRMVYCLQDKPWTTYATAYIELQPGEKDYECTIEVKKDKDGKYNSPRTLRFSLGDMKDVTVTLSNISFEEIK